MKIFNLSENSQVYTANVYLLTGSWNTLDDVNTLIDVGRDMTLFQLLEQASTGVGKKRVEQVILTHNHYDHASLLPEVIAAYRPKVYAASRSLEGVDVLLNGGEKLRVADRTFEVIATPGHSADSVCLYCEEEGILFAGDTPLVIRSRDTQYPQAFINALTYITEKSVKAIYFGHGQPLVHDCEAVLKSSLKHAKGFK